MDALSMMAYMMSGYGGQKKKSQAQLEAERLAERKRVDAEYGPPMKTEKVVGTKVFKKKKYPIAIKMMGKGFQNLHDSLGKD
jgi:hypothetical protein